MNMEPHAEHLEKGDIGAEFKKGNIGALARAISHIEENLESTHSLFTQLGVTGKEPSWRTGITGPPGAGKSTIAAFLAKAWDKEDVRTAFIAVDPSSEKTGGALLGDRIRLDEAFEVDGVYVRSMASRGSLGGLAQAAGAAADLCAAFGYREILLETVGVGQVEIDIASQADVVVVVLHPRSGDSVQAMKAGLLETADILLVNKADVPGAEATARDLEGALNLAGNASIPPVLCCSALDGKGMDDVISTMNSIRGNLEESGELELRREKRSLSRVQSLIGDGLRRRAWKDGNLASRARKLLEKGMPAEQVAGLILERALMKLSETVE